MKNAIKKVKVTLKSLMESVLFLVSFLMHGNKKLTDYDDSETGIKYRYAQFNLPAKKTCPYASTDCKKFCYAKRDERYTSVRTNRERSLKASKESNFAQAMIYTIKVAFMMTRYKTSTMILRIHESGDFYNLKYLKKWIAVFNEFMGKENIIFCFYTKCFAYLLALNETEKYIFRKATESGLVSCSLSLDMSTTKEQLALAMKVKETFPCVNIYFAVHDVESIVHDDICECADCAKCGKCVHASGKTIACKIH